MLFHVPTCAAGNFTPTQPSPIKGEGFEERHHARKNDTCRALRPKLSDPEAPVLGNAALLEAIDCHERLLKGSAVIHRGQLPAHCDSIALLDHIEDFQVYWRHEGSESRQHLAGARVTRWEGRRARLV